MDIPGKEDHLPRGHPKLPQVARDLIVSFQVAVRGLGKFARHLGSDFHELFLDPPGNFIHPLEKILRNLLAEPPRRIGLRPGEFRGGGHQGVGKASLHFFQPVLQGGRAAQENDDERGYGHNQGENWDRLHDMITLSCTMRQ
jgi:hypothetical protein